MLHRWFCVLLITSLQGHVMSGCLSFCDIMINQLSTDPSILKCHECYVRWGVQTRPSWGSDFFKLWPKGWKRASHGEQRKNAAGGSPEVRRSLPWAQPPLSGFAKLFLPFSTAPSRSSNLQKVRAGNPPSRGVGNPVALSLSLSPSEGDPQVWTHCSWRVGPAPGLGATPFPGRLLPFY